jgi:hypothetical protein
MPSYCVIKQSVARHNPETGNISFRHTQLKRFSTIEEARRYSKKVCLELRNNSSDTIYIVEKEERNVETWARKGREVVRLI